jgi:hypothetical protein
VSLKLRSGYSASIEDSPTEFGTTNTLGLLYIENRNSKEICRSLKPVMPFIQIPQPWQMPEREVTPEAAFLNRRRFLKGLMGAGIAAIGLPAKHHN